ncbi:hypothetical protein I316_07775 [Kwoniella heveanensis BCC8398]|uniref:DUF3752 domain-containing protein n=1 Tax=Kwoniella heveanensis BCC8398 TaxID=1296120 RepID=A0A1B9GHM9_9TREE|nr:hypothetical protein I316_07775 [Kwoniella heveanensis BCC8398]
MGIGPALPPHLAHLAGNGDRSPSPEGPAPPTTAGPAGPSAAGQDDEEDDDDFGPALPPHLLAARKANKVAGPTLDPVGRPLPSAGPSRASPPPGPSYGYDDDDSDDDVIGPMPVQASGEEETGSAVREFLEREERMRKAAEEKIKPKVQQREEWMLVPPSGGVLANVDPLRKRATNFNRTTTEPSDTDHTLWTETPAEKAQRIADEVAGIKRKKGKAGERIMSYEDEQEERRKRKREAEIRDEVAKHNNTQRGPSLLDQHASKLAKKKKDGKDDDAPAIWDHDRDMGITGRLLNDQERSNKIREARGLGDRFGHGKAGAYSM